MDKPLEPPDMPPLTEYELAEVRVMERELRNYLSGCCSTSRVLDPDLAFEYMRAYAVKFFIHIYAYYSRASELEHQAYRRNASEKFAYDRVVRCVDNNHAFDFFLSKEGRTPRLKKTISDEANASEQALSATAEDGEQDGLPSVSGVLSDLKREARLSAQKIADGIQVDVRTVQRHLAGEATPRETQIAAYEDFFTKRLKRAVRIEMP